MLNEMKKSCQGNNNQETNQLEISLKFRTSLPPSLSWMFTHPQARNTYIFLFIIRSLHPSTSTPVVLEILPTPSHDPHPQSRRANHIRKGGKKNGTRTPPLAREEAEGSFLLSFHWNLKITPHTWHGSAVGCVERSSFRPVHPSRPRINRYK